MLLGEPLNISLASFINAYVNDIWTNQTMSVVRKQLSAVFTELQKPSLVETLLKWNV